MRNKIIIGSVVSVCVLGMAAAVYFWFFAPQTITLSDGTKLTLLKVTYGKHHNFNGKDKKGRKIRAGGLTTTNDSICLWIEQKHKPNNWPNYEMIVYDSAKTSCAARYTMTYGGNFNNRDGTEIVGMLFDAFPRRGWRLHFYAMAWNPRNGDQELAGGSFAVNNPAHGGHFATWSPSSLPDTQSADDLSVTLTKLGWSSGKFGNPRQQVDAKDPRNKSIEAVFRVEQNGNAVTNWDPVQIEITDGTGNHTMNRSWSNRKDSDLEYMDFQWGLWPDEPAWKLRVEMSRSSGFTSDEMWTVHSIPLQPGNVNDMFRPDKKGSPFSETTLGDTHLEIYPILQPDENQARMYGDMRGFLQIHASPPPNGTRMTLLKVTDDQDKPINYYNWGWGGGDYRFALRDFKDVKSINVTLALHKSRYVEFMAKPAK